LRDPAKVGSRTLIENGIGRFAFSIHFKHTRDIGIVPGEGEQCGRRLLGETSTRQSLQDRESKP
jgi:hypothetical protein